LTQGDFYNINNDNSQLVEIKAQLSLFGIYHHQISTTSSE
jgi:hypothetical protein